VEAVFGCSAAPSPLAELDGFVTFFDPGWSILHLREAVGAKGMSFYPQNWYDNEPFAKTREKSPTNEISVGGACSLLGHAGHPHISFEGRYLSASSSQFGKFD